MAGTVPVHQQLLSLNSARKLTAILAAHIRATGAQPDRRILNACSLVRSEVPSTQVMQSPYLVVAIIVHGEVAQPYA